MKTHKGDIQSNRYLMWFRRDLRLHDNTALTMLMDEGAGDTNDRLASIKAVYALTPTQWLAHDMSIVQVDLLFRTLKQLAGDLFDALGVVLEVISTDTFDKSIAEIYDLCVLQDITQVFVNIEYEVNEQARDKSLAQRLAQHSIPLNRYHDQCILPPRSVMTDADSMYKVFTPFYKKWQRILATSTMEVYPSPVSGLAPISAPQSALDTLLHDIDSNHQHTLAQFASHYNVDQPTLAALLQRSRQDYPAGEQHARQRLKRFIVEDIQDYNSSRDQPERMATSQLSAYQTVGSLSMRLCYQQASRLLSDSKLGQDQSHASTDIERWISELAWRDFYRHVISDRPDIVKGNAYQQDTDAKVDWSYNQDDFRIWCEGRTGIPLVDAAMRCLNQTGFMHNRLRMVTAMFLTKDLLIDWRLGERYFMQQLIDGDFASNNGGWQWSASTGVDASPYFRIMNPFSQAKTHDKDAVFIKTWLPELKNVPAQVLHNETTLRRAVNKGGDFADGGYPEPMVDHKQARLYAIAQFKTGSASDA